MYDQVTLEERIGAFHKLGRLLETYLRFVKESKYIDDCKSIAQKDPQYNSTFEKIDSIIEEAGLLNPWFTRQNIIFSLLEITRLLKKEILVKWLSAYPREAFEPVIPQNIGVVLAGNIPLVGFHDFLSVLVSGHRFIGKLSSKDDRLMPLLGDLLIKMNGDFRNMIEFKKDSLSAIDAIIATGSDNTSRYFEYYFGKYPHIFRKNRNGVAVINGSENMIRLTDLAEDIFAYFGLGCRSVSKLFVPENYEFDNFFKAIEKYKFLADHNKYMNNYTYYKSVYLLNRMPFLDNGFLILKQEEGYHSPIACLFYESFHSPDFIAGKLTTDESRIQCVVGEELEGIKTIPAGRSQHPELWDYADNIDTIDFLLNLGNKKTR